MTGSKSASFDVLDGDLDVVLVHKLGAPGNPELAIGSEVVCLDTPDDFFAEGQFFEDFSQVFDEQAIAILRRGGTEAA